ncbi:MAG: translation initiation factor [Nitrososphaeraceae archaeon]
MVENDKNLNSMNYAINELEKCIPDIFIYTEIKKFNKYVTIIKGIHDKDLSASILRELKKKIGTGGSFKNGLIVLQGKHQDFIKKYLSEKNII